MYTDWLKARTPLYCCLNKVVLYHQITAKQGKWAGVKHCESLLMILSCFLCLSLVKLSKEEHLSDLTIMYPHEPTYKSISNG